MKLITSFFWIPFSLALLAAAPALAQHQGHGGHSHGDHNAAEKAEVKPPTVFLDKSPRIVQYQLDRLDNQRLLMVERSTDDSKYVPVYTAILSRAGMSPQYRDEALEALVELRHSSPAAELLRALEQVDGRDQQAQLTARELSGMLLKVEPETLKGELEAIAAAAESDREALRRTAYAALIRAGQAIRAREMARQSDDATIAWLEAIRLVPAAETRGRLREPIVQLVQEDNPPAVRRAAVAALAHVPSGRAKTFALVAPLIRRPGLRAAAVDTLLSIAPGARDEAISRQVVAALVEHAEQTPAEKRTSDRFLDAMQLVDRLMPDLPVAEARRFRERLRKVTVRVVQIKTVEEEMRYDVPYFAVEAGRSVQVVLENEDLMPHNLVVTVPGALKEVAQLGLAAGPEGGWQGKQYVPESDKVLHATDAVQPRQQHRLTFTAPSEPGEYPYVCTFPQHWYRMYGVMVVVEDLDAWLKNPVEPANPIGSNRSFVRSWRVEDFEGDLEEGMRGRSPEIGQRLFAEASCLGCHEVDGNGGQIGPDLTEVFSKWKGDRAAVLREILEPSHRIEDQYAMHLVLTVDGRTVSGIVAEENDDSVALLANPEETEPMVIPQDDIEEMVKTSTSMMPKALLDQYTKDEIFEVLAYLESVDQAGARDSE